MWIQSPDFGFLSVVQKPGDDKKGVLTVRARARDHLQSFINLLPEEDRGNYDIQEGGGTDYGFRIKMPKEVVGRLMQVSFENIDYDNFKNRCHQTLDDNWCSVLGRFWGIHYDYQERHG